jgi:hypothetical protein
MPLPFDCTSASAQGAERLNTPSAAGATMDAGPMLLSSSGETRECNLSTCIKHAMSLWGWATWQVSGTCETEGDHEA